jgi:hypothetical protein
MNILGLFQDCVTSLKDQGMNGNPNWIILCILIF